MARVNLSDDERRRIAARITRNLSDYEEATVDWRRQAAESGREYAGGGRSAGDRPPHARFRLWHQIVQRQVPAIFSRLPVPTVRRQSDADDPVARTAAQVLERAMVTQLEGAAGAETFQAFHSAAQDSVIEGRGVVWVRLDVAHQPVTTRVAASPTGGFYDRAGNHYPHAVQSASGPWVVRHMRPKQRVRIEWVPAIDFACTPATTWAEVKRNGWAARRLRVRRDDGIRQYGGIFARIPEDVDLHIRRSIDDDERQEAGDLSERARAVSVWEVWDARDRCVYYFAPSAPDEFRLLLAIEDPIGLSDFFPIPEPAVGNRRAGSAVPMVDYTMIQASSAILDHQTERIRHTTRKLRQAGFFDSTAQSAGGDVSEVLRGEDDVWIPVPGLASKGAEGAPGAVFQTLPLTPLVEALTALYAARQEELDKAYDIAGVTDVMRGAAPDPDETLGQSRDRLGQAMIRTQLRRENFARFVESAFEVMGEMTMLLLDDHHLRALSEYDKMPAVSKLPAEVKEELWAGALEILRNPLAAETKIEIDTDDTTAEEVESRQDGRLQFLASIKPLLEAMAEAGDNPVMSKVLGEMLMFVTRAFKGGRPLEAQIEQALKQLEAGGSEGGPPEPSDEERKTEARIAEAEQKARIAIEEAARKADVDVGKARRMAEVQVQKLIEETKARLAALGQELELRLKGEEAEANIKIANGEGVRGPAAPGGVS